MLWQLEGFQIEGKGTKGAAGTGADYTTILDWHGRQLLEFHERVMRKLDYRR